MCEGNSVEWCVLDNGAFKKYSPKNNKLINNAFHGGLNFIKLKTTSKSVGGDKVCKSYSVSIDMMWQQDCATTHRNGIVPISTHDLHVKWFYFSGIWREMDEHTTTLLNIWPRCRGLDNIVPCGSYNYSRNIRIFLQPSMKSGYQVNLGTNVVHPIMAVECTDGVYPDISGIFVQTPIYTPPKIEKNEEPTVVKMQVSDTDNALDLLNKMSIPYSVVEESTSDKCPICLEAMTLDSTDKNMTPVKLVCTHMYHGMCIVKTRIGSSIKCPICATLYGAPYTGNQPDNGSMHTTIIDDPLPGYTCKTCIITYTVPDGVQREHDPFPGHTYQGTQRQAFLPVNTDGEKALRLLKIAWERRLIFTVDYSLTHGIEGGVRITWNGIHHKTSMEPGSPYGYPDNGYFIRLFDELLSLGIM